MKKLITTTLEYDLSIHGSRVVNLTEKLSSLVEQWGEDIEIIQDDSDNFNVVSERMESDEEYLRRLSKESQTIKEINYARYLELKAIFDKPE